MPRREPDSSTLYLAIREGGTLDKRLREITAALNGPNSNNSEVLTAINNLDRKVSTMSSNIDRIEKEAADLAEDVTAVRTAVDDLRTLVTDLQAQVAQGQLDQARLDAAAAALEKVDDDLDAITGTTPPAPDTGGGENPPA